MLRKDIEDLMKNRGIDHIVLVQDSSDKLAMYCYLKAGFLVDCWGHRINRKKDTYGFLFHGVRYPWSDAAKFEEMVKCFRSRL